MDSDIVQFDMIGDLAIGFFGLPGDEVLGLGDSVCAGFVTVISHEILLEMVILY